MVNPKSSSEIEELVKRYLERHESELNGIRPIIQPGTARMEDSTWYVPVYVDNEPRRMSLYFEILGEVEEEISENEKVDVFVLPSGEAPHPR